MSTFRVEPLGLSDISAQLIPVHTDLISEVIPLPDPSMYGALVGSAATDAEPATTGHFNSLVHALGDLYGSIAERLKESSACYIEVEDLNVKLAGQIRVERS